MPDTTTKKSPATVPESLQAQKDLQLFYLFSTTLLSTMQLNKLLHLILSTLVCEENSLFCRAMLFLYNQKTNTLQGMLGICRKSTDGLQLVGADPANPLSGYWDLDEDAMASQRQSDFCTKVRETRIDLAEGCQIVSHVVDERRLYRIEDVECLKCQECDFISRFGVSSFAAVPLVTRNNLVGIIIVDNPFKHQPITDQQLQVLQLFANQAGMAIENTRLYRDLEEAHAELRDARQRLIHGAHLAAIGEMAASISHELKTPLITIGGFAARLGRMLPENTSQRHCLDTIISESHRLERLLGDILTFSRKPTICYQECDLAEIIRTCLADYAHALEERNIMLKAVIPSGTCVIQGDSSQLKQVCINLIVNAQEAITQDGTLRVVLTTKEERGKICAVASFADSGGGIPEDVLSKIFTPFFTTKRHGTGLGLAIVNRIIQNHDGILRVHNVGDGAEFQVVLPLAVCG
ncbi:MAG: GAF domain-containing sensor histidine kinase [Trichlorobacter sp.]|uniref:GAF domain-containing sensor histidine kinase n=1 Tax=Trichlorobacter sp. TaxID=2911007 RepID=UPI002565C9DC|nr:GAF domain-containing sensor histidine kinase [Trichlorobacter sp.]MDK9716562.1 GAF domain-containing sensor histidine kinase [Trichlorobacter sp.]